MTSRQKTRLSPSRQCRNEGLNGLVELSDKTGVSKQTLINWHKNKPKLFAIAIAGARALTEASTTEIKK